MILADRLAVLAAFLWFLVIWVVMGGLHPDVYMRAQYFQGWFNLWLVPVAVAWVLLRILDAVAGGPARRRGRVTYRRL